MRERDRDATRDATSTALRSAAPWVPSPRRAPDDDPRPVLPGDLGPPAPLSRAHAVSHTSAGPGATHRQALGWRDVLPLAALVLATSAVVGTGVRSAGAATGEPAPRTPLAAQPGLAPDEELVSSRLLPTGELRVDHWIQTLRPVTALTLGLPRSTAPRTPVVRSDGTVAPTTADVVATHLSVVADGVPQTGPRSLGPRPVSYYLTAARTVHVSYLLTGAVLPNALAPDRALLRPVLLDVESSPAGVRRSIDLSGVRVLGAWCAPADHRGATRACGRAVGTSWRVDLRDGPVPTEVSAQVALG